MADDYKLLESLLRRRGGNQSRLRSLTDRQAVLTDRASAPIAPTTGGGGARVSIGGRVADIPAPEAINWGEIAERGMGRYEEAKGAKELEQAETEDQDLEFEIANEIYQSTLKDDPEGAKLIKMAQMGIPGADTALANHLAPKTQSLAVLMQAVTSGNLDPAMAAEVAPQFGVSPDMAKRAAAYAMEARTGAEEEKFGRQLELARYKADLRGSGSGGSDKVSFDEYLAMSPDDREAYREFRGGRGSTSDGLTAGERQMRAKRMLDFDDSISKGEVQVAKFDDLRADLNKPEVFGSKQKTAQVLSEFDNPIMSGIGVSMRSKEVARLEDYVNSEVLTRMAALGGSDSNEELRKMRASLPSAMNNQETALALMDQVDAWQRRTLEIIKNRRRQLQTGEYFELGEDTEAPDYIRQDPVQPTPKKPSGKIKILSIE